MAKKDYSLIELERIAHEANAIKSLTFKEFEQVLDEQYDYDVLANERLVEMIWKAESIRHVEKLYESIDIRLRSLYYIVRDINNIGELSLERIDKILKENGLLRDPESNEGMNKVINGV